MNLRFAFSTCALAIVAGTGGCLFLVNEPADGSGGAAGAGGGGATQSSSSQISAGGGGTGGNEAACPAATITLGTRSDLEVLGEATFYGIVGEPGGSRFAIAVLDGSGLGLHTFEVTSGGTIALMNDDFTAPSGVAITSSMEGDNWRVWVAEDEGVQRCDVDSAGTLTCDEFTFELLSGVTGVAVGDDVYASLGSTSASLARFDLQAPGQGDVLVTFDRASKVLALSEGQLVFNAFRDGDGGGGAGPVSSLELCAPGGCPAAARKTLALGGTMEHVVLKNRGGTLEAYAIAGGQLVGGTPSSLGSVAVSVGDGVATALAREGDHLLVGIDGSLRDCCLADGTLSSTDACTSQMLGVGEQIRAIQPLSASHGVILVAGGASPALIPYTLD